MRWSARAALAALLSAPVAALSSAPSSAIAGLRTAPSLGEEVRSQFPALLQQVHGTDLVYLDSAATSQKPQCVLDVETAYYSRDNANVHRGAHTLATRATEAYEAARDKVASFVGAKSRDEIVWTRGATEAINLVAYSWADMHLKAGDEIVLTVAEHHSNIVPWQLLAERSGIVLKFAPLDSLKQRVDVDALEALCTSKTKLIAISHVSNVLGTVTPVKRVVDFAKTLPDCAVLLDACQSAPHMRLNVAELGCDFVVASGHKMCGPTGIGFLWASYDRLLSMRPWHGGGEMIDVVSIEGSTFALPPARFEAGTPPIAQAIALGRACDFLVQVGMDRVEAHEAALGKKLFDQLSAVQGITVYGPTDGHRSALAAFNSDKLHASDLAFFLDQEGVAVRSGHHCAQPLHAALGVSHSCRASLGVYNTEADVDSFVSKLREVLDFYA
ncbi:aminotransferase class V domain-containing protein [Pelagophyceae sp. CCMP2097]|nr:aminotransferase class V domain-containing protein [Pelagophyceae sp. CCMP2097]